MTIAATFVVAAVLSACCLWAVSTWRGARIPIVDLLIIAGLCSALALLPRAGWALATLILALLPTRATDADPWPDAVLMVVGSNVVWMVTKAMLLA